MSVLVFTENWEGKFKKLSFELVSYANEIAKKINAPTIALSIGEVQDDELNKLRNYGAKKIISAVADNRLNYLVNQAYSSIIAQVSQKESATVIIFSNNFTGKALAPRVAVKLKAGVASGVTELPLSVEPFTIKKRVFSGSGYGNIIIKSPVKILTLLQNSFEIIEAPSSDFAGIENFTPELKDTDFKTELKDVQRVKGKILLTDAEIVVAGGRGMKGPQNWGYIEELAQLLGAATACSRPVSDEGWRPPEEHAGQTGKIIAPNLYIACGISGAIQHLAGVSGSKCIVAINTDKDAPIFQAATYGIVGDAIKVLPELITAVKEFKGS